MHYYVFLQLAKKAINWYKKAKQNSEEKKEGKMKTKEISSLLMGKTQQLCVYSHLFVLSRFQAPHMDRCFPFHSSELDLDGEIAVWRCLFSLLGLAIIWRCYDFIMLIQPSFM